MRCNAGTFNPQALARIAAIDNRGRRTPCRLLNEPRIVRADNGHELPVVRLRNHVPSRRRIETAVANQRPWLLGSRRKNRREEDQPRQKTAIKALTAVILSGAKDLAANRAEILRCIRMTTAGMEQFISFRALRSDRPFSGKIATETDIRHRCFPYCGYLNSTFTARLLPKSQPARNASAYRSRRKRCVRMGVISKPRSLIRSK